MTPTERPFDPAVYYKAAEDQTADERRCMEIAFNAMKANARWALEDLFDVARYCLATWPAGERAIELMECMRILRGDRADH